MNKYNKNVIDKAKLIDADAVIKQNYTLGPLLNVMLSNVIKIGKQICITIIISFMGLRTLKCLSVFRFEGLKSLSIKSNYKNMLCNNIQYSWCQMISVGDKNYLNGIIT